MQPAATRRPESGSGSATVQSCGGLVRLPPGVRNRREWATFCNHFTSVEEAAYAISVGFGEFQLLDYGGRHLGADPANVALRTLRAILDYVTNIGSCTGSRPSGRSATG
jgi:hypothetical protein